MLSTTDDLRIASLKPLISPALLIDKYPLAAQDIAFINQTRRETSQIIQGKDHRLLVIVGPCSIHDEKAALEYGQRLAPLIKQYQSDLHILMRVYFEKPRTTVGWKGLINDPDLNNSFDINQGLKKARRLLLRLNQMGVGTATEFLDTIIPQFISDLISWGAIGARTTESQIHRELASGLSMPVGFKNGTGGNTQIAIDAIGSARHPHHFLSVTKDGIPAIVSTKGNEDAHVILRGGKNKTNYDTHSVNQVLSMQQKANLRQRLMIDCSHGNSGKDHTKQAFVLDNIAQQLNSGEQGIGGVMIESHLIEGNQPLTTKEQLVYGQSITDSCIDWSDTTQLLAVLARASQARQQLSLRESA